MNKRILFTLLGTLTLLALFMANLLIGSVDIPFQEAMATLRGDENVRESWRFIILRSRLPQAVAALLAGSSLAASGLMLQTAFANPLAGPDVFGINSGAGPPSPIPLLAPTCLASTAGRAWPWPWSCFHWEEESWEPPIFL